MRPEFTLLLLGALLISGPASSTQPQPPPQLPDLLIPPAGVEFKLIRAQTSGAVSGNAGWNEAAEALRKRLAILPGKAEVLPDGESLLLTVRDGAPDALQLDHLLRPGRIRLYELKDFATQGGGRARYAFEHRLLVQGGESSRQDVQVKDRRTGRVQELREFLAKQSQIVDNDDIAAEGVKAYTMGPVMVRLELKEKASRRIEKIGKGKPRLLALTLDGEVVSVYTAAPPAPRPRGDAGRDALQPLVIDLLGPFRAPDEAAYLALALKGGPLPFGLRIATRRDLVEPLEAGSPKSQPGR